MAELKGTQVAATVVPFTDADKYATHDAEYGKGGFRSVETIALRNAIPTERKTKGMVVRVNETGLHYYWNGSAWTEWLPKGTMLVDAMFDIYSTNPVQNKVITTRINEHAANFDDIYSKIENIPIITGKLNAIESWKDTIGTKGAANGVAGLDSTGKIPASQLPAGYDNVDMLQSFVTTNPSSNMRIGQKFYNTKTKKIFTATSATTGVETAVEGGDKIYINITENKSYRWTGTTMVVVGDGSGVALGTTSSTAFRGDYGNTLYTNFGSGTNLQGTKDARNFFYNMSLFNPLTNTSILKDLVVQPEANFVRLQNDIVYLIGEVNTGDGYDIPAATTTKAGVMTADMYKTLQEIELATFPLSLTASGGGTFEVGSSNKNAIGIIVTRKGTDVTSSSTITVTASGSVTGSLSSDKKTWTPSTNISSNTSVAVKATYGSQNATKTVKYTFKYKKYWGTSTSASLTSSQVIALKGSTWADSKSMGATTFDCTGGKYVYYVIPDVLGTPEFWVGGLKNTDINVGNIPVTNASGGSARYLIMRLANIQTGVLSVEFK